MKVTLCYIHVAGLIPDANRSLENYALLDDYSASAERFVKTLKQFSPGFPYQLLVTVGNGPLTAKIKQVYEGIPCRFVEYNGLGWDIGSHQFAAPHSDCDFAVFASSRVFFNRDKWLKRLVEARKKHGEGIYSAHASMEACPLTPGVLPNPHLRTALFGMNPRAFKAYPNKIETREDTFAFESGEWSIGRWFSDQKMPVKMVTWDGEYDLEDCRKPGNVFRKGDQSNLIAGDRHTAIYDAATPEDKKFLERISNGEEIK